MFRPSKVLTSKKFEKRLYKLPTFIKAAILIWISTVEEIGIRETRKLKGYHDEPLRGQRKEQRSIRLNRSYRLFYTEQDYGLIDLITVDEVSKHEY